MAHGKGQKTKELGGMRYAVRNASSKALATARNIASEMHACRVLCTAAYAESAECKQCKPSLP